MLALPCSSDSDLACFCVYVNYLDCFFHKQDLAHFYAYFTLFYTYD